MLAHECGHQAFSKHQLVNDTIGLLIHSCMLVPYFSWKHSHRRHHSNCVNNAKDTAHVPRAFDEALEELEVKESAPYRLFIILVSIFLGLPLYLLTNLTGRKYAGQFVNHFDPYCPLFTKRERREVMISDAALLLVVYGLVSCGQTWGWLWLLKVYGVPYFITSGWVVLITLMQHTHPNLPHYTDEEWDWLRGALSTVDRSFGFLDHFFHHVADTHVAHHLFPTIPFYHAVEATEVMRPILKEFYHYDARTPLAALWTDWVVTHYLAPDQKGSGILWYRK